MLQIRAGSYDAPRTSLLPPTSQNSVLRQPCAGADAVAHTQLRLRGGGDVGLLKLGQYYLVAMSSFFAIFIATSPTAFLDAYKVTGPKNPVPAEGTAEFELIKLLMKWWSSAILSGG